MAALDNFRKLIRQHDVTYEYSDDNGVWRRGWGERFDIIQKAHDLVKAGFSEADVIKCWNDVMDSRFVPGEGKNWHWTKLPPIPH